MYKRQSQSGAGKGRPLPVELRIIPLAPTEAQTAFLHRLYETNARLQQYPLQELRPVNILPAVKQAIPAEGEMLIESKIALSFHRDFANEGKLLKEKLENTYGVEAVSYTHLLGDLLCTTPPPYTTRNITRGQ